MELTSLGHRIRAMERTHSQMQWSNAQAFSRFRVLSIRAAVELAACPAD